MQFHDLLTLHTNNIMFQDVLVVEHSPMGGQTKRLDAKELDSQFRHD